MWKRIIRDAKALIQNFKEPVRFHTENLLFEFGTKDSLKIWRVFSDEKYGGYSTASFSHNEQGFATFSGSCTTAIQQDSTMKRSGFCGIRSDSEDFIDMSEFDRIVLKIRGTPQSYLASVRTYNFVTGSESKDVWQAFFTCKGDEWHEVSIPIYDFVLTWKGRVVPEITEMNSSRIMSLGITMSLSPTSAEKVDFYLDIKTIKAALFEYD